MKIRKEVEYETLQEYMGMNDKGGYSKTMSIPIVNIIVSVILTIGFPFYYLEYLRKRKAWVELEKTNLRGHN